MLLNASDIKILYPKLKEADPNNIVPTTTTSFVMLLCDCIATTVMEKRKFSKENFFLYHKGGNLGASLRLAKDIMVSGSSPNSGSAYGGSAKMQLKVVETGLVIHFNTSALIAFKFTSCCNAFLLMYFTWLN